jgi:predicted nucleic acid-binding protein
MTTVSNSSPLIGLSAIGSLNLLNSLYGTIHIPEAVYEEVVVKGHGRTGAQEVDVASWIIRHTVTDAREVTQLRDKAGLHQGESEAIMLAIELHASEVILDDPSARHYATEQKLPVIGTVGVLLVAKTKGLIPSVKSPLDALIAFGFRINPIIYQAVLRTAGE